MPLWRQVVLDAMNGWQDRLRWMGGPWRSGAVVPQAGAPRSLCLFEPPGDRAYGWLPSMFPSANDLRPASKGTLDSRNKLLVTGFQCSLGSGHPGSNVAQRPAPPGVVQGSQSYVLHPRGHRRHHPRRTDAAPPPLERAPAAHSDVGPAKPLGPQSRPGRKAARAAKPPGPQSRPGRRAARDNGTAARNRPRNDQGPGSGLTS